MARRQASVKGALAASDSPTEGDWEYKPEMWVKNLRTSLDLTQMELAEWLGVTYVTISRWENGQARPNRLAIKALTVLAKADGRLLVAAPKFLGLIKEFVSADWQHTEVCEVDEPMCGCRYGRARALISQIEGKK